jgi:NAD-dependent DNA ligase
MKREQAKSRHAQLVAEIRRYDHACCVEDQQIITDSEYDRLFNGLSGLEKIFPISPRLNHPSKVSSTRQANIFEYRCLNLIAARKNYANDFLVLGLE